MTKLTYVIRDYKTKFNLYRRLVKMGLEISNNSDPHFEVEATLLLQQAENDPEALEDLKNLIKKHNG